MIIRVIKTALIGIVAYKAAHAAKAQAKLLIVRAEAKTQMDELEASMQHAFKRTGPHQDADDDEAGQLFTMYFVQYKRVSKIYAKTF